MRPYAEHLKKKWPWVILHAAETHRRMKNYGKALRQLDKVLQLDPLNNQALLRKAMTLAAMGRQGDARAQLEKISDKAMRLPEFAFWSRAIPLTTDH
jgi:Flp pilus assembly protein TadD